MVIQNNGENYVSELINDRYQILKSDINKEFFIFDAVKDDNLRERGDSATWYFKTIEGALSFLNVKNVDIKPLNNIVSQPKTEEVIIMDNVNTATMDEVMNEVEVISSAVVRELNLPHFLPNATVRDAEFETVVEEPAPVVTETIIEKKGRKPSAFGLMIKLIKETDMNDADILAEVQKQFPDSKYHVSMVKHHRKKLAAG